MRRRAWAGLSFFLLLPGLFRLEARAATFYVAPSGSDANTGTSPASPFATIQKGLDSALGGDTVSVAAGTYAISDAITMSTSGVTLSGAGWPTTTIDGGGSWGGGGEGSVADIWVEPDVTGVTIQGFTITGRFHGIFLDEDTLAVVQYNRIGGNFLNDVTVNSNSSTVQYNLLLGSFGGYPFAASSGIDTWYYGTSLLQNNTIVGASQIGICYLGTSTPTIVNNIIVNSAEGIGSPSSTGGANILYNDIWSNQPNFDFYTHNHVGLTGNISADPVFVSSATGDYRLRSCSPAIDAGDPSAQFNDPDATRNDMGAFYVPGGHNSLLPPSQLSAVPISGGRVALSWLASPSTQTVRYDLYYAPAASFDYTALQAQLPVPQASYTTPRLSTGTLYEFALRASDGVCEEPNNTVVAFATPQDNLPEVRAVIKVPKTGHKVNGNSLTVMAELVIGTPEQTKQVEFQYRSAFPDQPDQPWTPIPARDVNHPNPDTDFPYFIHWDVTVLPPGIYEIRAVATALDNSVDPDPPYITVTVDSNAPDERGQATATGVLQTESVHNSVGNIVTVADSGSTGVTQLVLPAGSLSTSSSDVTIEINPTGVPPLAAPRALTNLLSFRQVTLAGGAQLQGPAYLTVGYPDANGSGLVDGTRTSPANLELDFVDPVRFAWVRLGSPTAVDPQGKTVTFVTPHFTVFGLFAPSAADLSALQVFPVPWVPNDGIDDNGKPFSSSDPNSGIIFAALTGRVRIEIFSLTGQLVWRRDTDASGGRIQWDVRNQNGRDVASGAYFAVVTDLDSGQKIVRKLAVIR